MFRQRATERLILRELSVSDVDRLRAYRSDPRVSKYQSWVPDTFGIQQLACMDPGAPGTWYQAGISLRTTGELIGDCGIHTMDDPRLAEVGITLAPEFQGRGLATEALRSIIDFLFGELRMHRISASVDPRNLASMRLMQRSGFRQEGHLLESIWSNGEWVDDAIFAILASEWRGL